MQPLPRLLADLVAIPSVNPMGRPIDQPIYLEDRVTAYLEECFRELHVPYERQVVQPRRENIVATFEPAEPTCTLVWEVHQDTVPVDAMTIDPFGGEVRDGRVYGRGACDVKGSMAVMLAVFERLWQSKPPTACNLILACTVDEEHTFLGVQELMRRGMAVSMAVVAEPTTLKIVDAHKGVARWKVNAVGLACHSSRPEDGINAIYAMGEVLRLTQRYANGLASREPHPRLGAATLSVGRIEGGVSVNTVPDSCTIEIDRRLLPGESAEAAHAEYAAAIASCGTVRCGPLWLDCPALDPTHAGPAIAALGRAIAAIRGSYEVIAVPFGTDASTISNRGIPTVVFGPGDIAQAHTKDEWIAVDQMVEAEAILWELVTTREI